MVRKIFIVFLAWRFLLFLPLIASQLFLSVRPGFDYTINRVWANFDGIYYLYIAKAGYTVDNAGFFPMYPLLIRIFSIGESAVQFYVALILSSLFLLLSLFVFYKLLRLDQSKNSSILTIIVMLIFPTSFFFAVIYAESLFFLLLVLSFYFARKGNWVLCSFFAILLTATRLVGIAILPALILEFYLQNKTLFSKKFFPTLLTPLGLIYFSMFNLVSFGNAFQFAKAQGSLLNNRSVDQIILFPQTIFRYIKILTSLSPRVFEWWVAFLELSSFIFVALLLYIAWKKKIRISYLLFAFFAFLIPASTGTLTGFPRYILVIFPIFVALALIKNRWFKVFYFVIAPILLFILFMLFSKGYYVS